MQAELETKTLIPIPGTEYEVLLEVASRGMSLWEIQLYAQDNGLEVLSSADVNTVARAVKSDPSKSAINLAIDRNPDLSPNTVRDAYRQLKEQIHDYDKGFWITANEILMWRRNTSTPSHPRISYSKQSGELESYLIKKYKVVDRGKQDYAITDAEMTPIDWPKEGGTISKELAKALNTESNTYVYTDTNPDSYEGLRALGWDFRLRGGPGLYSSWIPRGRISDMGSLLGRDRRWFSKYI